MRAFFAASAALAAVYAVAQSASEYDPAAEVTVRGVVTEMHESKVATDHPGLHLVLKTETESVEVHACPVRFLSELEFTIDRGDKLTVLGSRPTGAAVIVAREIRKGQESLIVRDAKGAPNWLPR
jgi:hypothetical protein